MRSRSPLIGDVIRTRRLARGLTQAALARRAGLHHVHLSQIETGRRAAPSLWTLGRLARALGTTIGALVAGSRSPRRPKARH